MKIAVIGGGAAGFFAAISAKKHHPEAEIQLFEKTSKTLAKVAVSGGGRCNVTHDCRDVKRLATYYPRGGDFLKHGFREFSVDDTQQWFLDRGVELKTEADGRMFPTTDDSQTIVDALLRSARDAGVRVRLNAPVRKLISGTKGISLTTANETEVFDAVVVASGGYPKRAGLAWLEELGHQIVDPVPSLFTFNMPGESITKLMGIAVEKAEVRVIGTKLRESGPLLITHWGMSGPAVLKTSAFGARVLAGLHYEFDVMINWIGGEKEHELRARWEGLVSEMGQRKVVNRNPFGLPSRLWEYLLDKAEISKERTWAELGNKGFNRLINILLNDTYQVKGKTTFKEEFVTAGGVDLRDVDPKTMQSKVIPGLYFAGEVLDIDGVTGGFNFQAAWTTGWIAGKLH